MNFKKANNIAGWVIGGIATLVYLLTMEATASFWDCGEFASVAYKMEVGHSPGAPLFMMLQRMFALLAGGKKDLIAPMINSFSAICSGLTILFLFWTITHMAKKLLAGNDAEPDGRQRAMILGAGAVGALAYTFSDTFWFSAVESEVYACSSVFTGLTFWAILKWESLADRRHADRWLILIAYLIGLSLAIHLLNLLCIPAIVMVYYFRRPASVTRQLKTMAYLVTSFAYLIARRVSSGTWEPSYIKKEDPKSEVTVAGSIVAFISGCIILGFVQWASLNGLPNMASWFEIKFVNDFGLPYDSGALVFVVLLIGALVALLVISRRIGDYLLQRGTLMVIFVLMGLSTYVVPMIRSRADVPIDMTNPDGPLTLASYLQREQFGQQPLLYGPDFDAITMMADKELKPRYAQSKDPETGKDYYEKVGEKPEYEFDKKRFFPRIWDNNDPNHQRFYASFLGMETVRDPRTGREMTDEYGRPAYDREPTTADNMKFFIGYQMNWMWWRYFMWNYAGRQNDFEGQGDAKNGNWISGIGPIDKLLGRGNINKMADGYVNNGARNQLYFLPLILGILGFVYQFNRSKRDGSVVATLFFFTGIAIGIYLNMTPLQPRERDYAFAGSTYAFAIWIGLGVLMVAEWMQKVLKGASAAYAATAICLLLVPGIMLKEEWDDHNRSKKTLARATAYNTLASCEKNAVLFTVGDNETYPLWYAQEIEGFRPDVRVINTSLLGIDWYIDQLNYRINDADLVPMIWKHDDYVGDRQNYIRLQETPAVLTGNYAAVNGSLPVDKLIEFLVDPKFRNPTSGDGFFPTASVSIPGLSTDQMVTQKLMYPEDAGRANTDMRIRLGKGAFSKGELAQLNIIAANARTGWKRPIYFSNLQEMGAYGNLSDFCRQEGTVYRLMPYSLTDSNAAVYGESGFIDVKKTQQLFNGVYTYGGGERTDVYFDEKNRQMFIPYRITAARVANQLSAQGKTAEALKVLDGVMAGITEKSYAYDNIMMLMGQAYYNTGEAGKAKASALAGKVAKNAADDAAYIISLRDDQYQTLQGDVVRDLNAIMTLGATAAVSGDKAGSENMLSLANTLIKNAVAKGAEAQGITDIAVRGFIQQYVDPSRRNEADFAELSQAINFMAQKALSTNNQALSQALNNLIQQLNADRQQSAQPVPAAPLP